MRIFTLTDLQPEAPFAIAGAVDYLSVGVGRTLCTWVGVGVTLGARVGGVIGG